MGPIAKALNASPRKPAAGNLSASLTPMAQAMQQWSPEEQSGIKRLYQSRLRAYLPSQNQGKFDAAMNSLMADVPNMPPIVQEPNAARKQGYENAWYYDPDRRVITAPEGAWMGNKGRMALHEATHLNVPTDIPGYVPPLSESAPIASYAPEVGALVSEGIANAIGQQAAADSPSRPMASGITLLPFLGQDPAWVAQQAKLHGVRPGTADFQRLYNQRPEVRQWAQMMARRAHETLK